MLCRKAANPPLCPVQTSEMDKPGPAILKNGLFWATSYAFISILITLTNKVSEPSGNSPRRLGRPLMHLLSSECRPCCPRITLIAL